MFISGQTEANGQVLWLASCKGVPCSHPAGALVGLVSNSLVGRRMLWGPPSHANWQVGTLVPPGVTRQ